MSLPQLNSSPKYSLRIPSSGKEIKFRPYLVREEKVLLMALETKDVKSALNAVVDTIISCVDETIRPNDLTTFDVEYMFTQIRAKSSGENSTILVGCTSCEHKNEVNIPLDELSVDVPLVERRVKLGDDISIELKYPSYSKIIQYDLEDADKASTAFDLAGSCIDSIIHGEERIDATDVSTEQLSNFLDSMTTQQFQGIAEFISTIPKLQHNVAFACESCQKDNLITLEGMQNFF